MNSSISYSPSPWVVLPHYIFAAMAFLVLNVLLLFSTDAFAGHYFHPQLLTLTHIAALGWGTMTIFGALYQLLPVVLEIRLYSEKLGIITFVFLALGTVLIAPAFWFFQVGLLLHVAACFLLFSFILFFINIYLTAKQVQKWPIEADFIVTSGIWLLLTGIVGALMAFNFTMPFLPENHLHFLKLHAHLGVAGWFLLLIIGVASKLLPMFMLSHAQATGKLNFSYYAINAGLVFFVLDHLLLKLNWHWPSGILVVAGVFAFLWFLYGAYQQRMRKDQEPGMQLSFVAVLLMLLPVALVFVVNQQGMISEALMQHLYLVYGISIFMGFVSALILGQTYKTLPFIIWMHKYEAHVGRFKTPLPKDLYSHRIATFHNFCYLAGLFLLLAGVFLGHRTIITSGSGLLLAAALLFVYNVGKILFHQVSLQPFLTTKQQQV